MQNITKRLYSLFASNGFFWAIIIFFIFQTLWYIFSAAYPMAFDEDFHLGVIRIYAEQWSPFLASQPEGADAFGAVARDPSYLFHYLMSFPYRVLAFISDSEAFQVIALRLINLAMFTGGLLLFRRLLQRMRVSPALTNVIFALFTMVPIVPHLAATINYDNLLFLLLPALFLLAHTIVTDLQKKKLDIVILVLFIVLSVMLALIKYAALPILVGLVGFLVYFFLRNLKGRYARFFRSLKTQVRKIPIAMQLALGLLLIISFGLFAQRYVVNTIEYGHPVPDCGKVLSVEQCMSYGPWARNHELSMLPNVEVNQSPIAYTLLWLEGMHHRSFFTLGGPGNDYATRDELPVPAFAAIIIAVIGSLCVVLFSRKVFRNKPMLQALTVLTLFYVCVLWVQLYSSYLQTGQPVAINGRYLVPLLIPIGVLLATGISFALQRLPNLKVYAASLAIILFFWGGGVFTYTVRHETEWLWQNETVRQMNASAKYIVERVVIK